MDQHALAMDQFPGIAKYDIQEELGHGGMATVYRARDRRLGRDVALKVIHRHLRDNGEVARRFVAEARAVAKLKHPNIVEIYDVSEEDAPERFLVAELVRGKSLRRLLSEHGPLPPEVVACLGVELASALAHAHDRGVIHRDVKPENVLFSLPWADDTYGESSEPSLACVKLTDFGIAKLLDQQGVTSTGQVLGSPAYMAPEQIEGDTVDARADVFALGVLLYECMVGRLPFEGKTPGQILKAILQGQYTPADQERPAVGARWARILQRAIEPDAIQRYTTMVAFRAALETELASLGIFDLRRELTSFLRTPEDYEAHLLARLVPLLREQGRCALRKGDCMAAADAINRACALAPGDPEVMELVQALVQAGSLTRWRARLLAAAAFCGTSVLLGTVGWWFLRPPPPTRARSLPVSSFSLPVFPPPTSSQAPPSSSSAAVPPPSSSVSHRIATPVVGPRASSGTPASELRKVRFFLFPPSARWNLDGNPLPDTNLYETELPVGSSHTIEAYTLPNNSCCESPHTVRFEVKPTNGTEVQSINVSMPLLPGKLQVQGSAGLYFLCPTLFGDSTLRSVGRTYQVKVPRLREEGTCFLRDGPKKLEERSVVILPGQTTLLAW
ncbi:MAG: protein kinase [Myxococcales bacterium]|nr:serine/threonine protein kinase [Polyangiaceae bacterium]MDW8250083.1 protein kinase [Myxococcales bacterium]